MWRAAGGGLAPDRLARASTTADHVRPETRERVLRGDARARLPAELGRARARHRPVADARGGQLRHDALRPGVDAVRDRARRARRGLLREHRQRERRSTAPRCSAPSSGCARRASTASSSSRRRSRAARGRRCTCRPTCRSWRSRRARRTTVPVVAVDQFAGAAAATRHLLELGHRTVWHVAGPADWLEARAARSTAGGRARGGRRRRRRRSLRATGARAPATSSAGGCATVRDVTAIFAANDQMALGVLRALHEAGREVPRDISIVGFDDIPEAAVLHAAADDRAPGLQRDGAPERDAAARRDRVPATLVVARRRRARAADPREHRAATRAAPLVS